MVFKVGINLEVFIRKKFFFYFYSGMIDDKPLRFRGEVYHPYHFNCASCGMELNSDAREVKHRPGYTNNDMVSFII